MQLHCFNGMIDFFVFFFGCGGGSGRGGDLYRCACYVIEGGVYFVCEWEMYWAGEDNVGVLSVVEHNVREERG